MKKIGVCGVYGVGPEFSGGQPVKTRMIIEELTNQFGIEQIQTANTHNWKKNPFKLIVNCFKLVTNCENIIIMPAHNGLKIFIPLFLILNKIYRKRIHYIVIGGWLPEHLTRYKSLKKGVAKLSGVYVETSSMKRELVSLGMDNVYIMNNFKKLTSVRETDLKNNYVEPYKLCFFSRIVKEKGIEDAIKSVINVNEILGREVYHLDLYGYIDESYKASFEEIIEDAPSYIKYHGVVDPNKSVGTLKNYFMQVFPTRYKTEGIPGSIIDSYYAGLPVLASRWNSFADVIEEGITGIGFEFGNCEDLEFKLIEIACKPQLIIGMKKNCLEKAIEYSTDYVMSKFITHIEGGV